MDQTTTNFQLDEPTRRFISGSQGFYERYVKMLAYYETNEQAYEATERQYAEVVGKRRFANFQSFKTAYSQFCRRRRPRSK